MFSEINSHDRVFKNHVSYCPMNILTAIVNFRCQNIYRTYHLKYIPFQVLEKQCRQPNKYPFICYCNLLTNRINLSLAQITYARTVLRTTVITICFREFIFSEYHIYINKSRPMLYFLVQILLQIYMEISINTIIYY